jgi:hypothetical protein
MTNFKDSTTLKKIILVLAVIIVVAFLGYSFGQRQIPSETKEIEKLATPTLQTQLTNELEFPIEEAPIEDANFKIILTEAKKVKLISMQGNPVEAEAGKEFLILSFEIENENNFPFEIDSQHYLRLQDESGKNYAPDFYNGSLEIPAAATKKDELAFTVSAEQKQFKLLLGPITEEEKEIIEINF